MDPLTISSALNAGGSILSAFGGGKKKSTPQVSGFQSLPSDIRDYMLKTLYPDMQGIYSKPYEGIPRRRVTQAETEGPFGNPALKYLQDYYDTKYTAPVAAAPTSTAPDADMMRAYAIMGAGANDGTIGQKMNAQYSRLFNDPERMKAVAALMKKYGWNKASDFTTIGGSDLLAQEIAKGKK